MKLPEILFDFGFEKSDIYDLRHTIQIAHDTAKGFCEGHGGHFGLGISTALLIGIVVYGKGAVLQTGEMGVGKSVKIEALERFCNNHGIRVWNQEQTMAGSDDDFNEGLSNKHVLWSSDDLAKLSPTVQLGMVKVVGALSQKRSCKVKTGMYHCNIERCDLSFITACTFDLYDSLWQIPEWRGSSSDRILRFASFAYKRPVVNKRPILLNALNPIPELNPSPKLAKGEMFREIVDILKWQFTEERAQDYAERYLKGIAILEGMEEVTEAHMKFLKLFEFNVETEGWVGSRRDETAPLIIDSRALYDFSEAVKYDGITASSIAYSRGCDESKVNETIDAYPDLFRVENEKIYPNRKIVEDHFKPQLAFETMSAEMNLKELE